MTSASAPVQRPGRWALPPQPPETWPGSTTTLLLLAGLAASLAMPTLVLLPKGGTAAVVLSVLYALGAVLSAVNTYLLLLQTGVTQDRRLGWAAGGFATLWLVYLLRSVDAALPGQAADEADLDLAAALSWAWLAVLPLVALTAALRRRSAALFAVPLGLVAAGALGVRAAPVVDPGDVSLTGTGRLVFLVTAAVALLEALWWRTRVPIGNRGAWGWVGAALLLTPVVAAIRALSIGEQDPTAWAALVVEVVALLVPAAGLYVLSARGYLRQARCWRRLESEVRQLRASSALLPGLSITPEDEAGLPERPEVQQLVARGEMQVALQPVLDLASGQPVGQEALARFGGRVPTDRWFRAAGLHGLAFELERMTLARALATLGSLPPEQFLALNTSPAALHDEDVLRMLHANDLSRVVIEITEHDAVNDYEVTRQELGRLRDAGARIAVDDVGAGFASLRHVLLLQPDVVKLDTSLTRDVHENARQAAIVRAVVTFANEVGAVVLAEGIEVAEQVPALVDAGVTLGQGWHLGIPVIAP